MSNRNRSCQQLVCDVNNELTAAKRNFICKNDLIFEMSRVRLGNRVNAKLDLCLTVEQELCHSELIEFVWETVEHVEASLHRIWIFFGNVTTVSGSR